MTHFSLQNELAMLETETFEIADMTEVSEDMAAWSSSSTSSCSSSGGSTTSTSTSAGSTSSCA